MPRRLDDAVRNEALVLWGQGRAGKEIEARLRANPVVARSGDAAPSVRTIQRWIADEERRRAAEASGGAGHRYWVFTDGDAGIVLPMLAAMAEARDGGIDGSAIDWVLADQARRIARGFPDMPPIELYWLATNYAQVEAEERRLRRGRGHSRRSVSPLRASLDLYLAFTPWRDAGARYGAAIWARKLGPIRPLRTPSTASELRELPPKTSAIEWPFDLPDDAGHDRQVGGRERAGA